MCVPPGTLLRTISSQYLSYRKRPQIAVVAVARELVGFLWEGSVR